MNLEKIKIKKKINLDQFATRGQLYQSYFGIPAVSYDKIS